MRKAGSRSATPMRHHSSGTSRLMSWSTRVRGPRYPALVRNTGLSETAKLTKVALRSYTGGSALKGPLVSAPSLPAPVVDGDLPVMLEMNSMNASGNSMWWIGP